MHECPVFERCESSPRNSLIFRPGIREGAKGREHLLVFGRQDALALVALEEVLEDGMLAARAAEHRALA